MKPRKTAAIAFLLVAAGAQLRAADLAAATRALLGGDYRRAEQTARAVWQDGAGPPEAGVLLARAEMAQGKLQQAYERLRQVLRRAPAHPDGLYFLSKLSFALSQQSYERLYALAPRSARVHQLLAESHAAREDVAAAEKEYRAALRADPRSVEVRTALGDLLRRQSRFEEAAAQYARALALNPHNYDAAYGLGACRLFQNQPAVAVRYLRKALEAEPDAPAARLALGDALLRLGDAASARRELQRALALEPEMRQAYVLLGRALQKLGKPEEARQAFDKARELGRRELEAQQALLSEDELIPRSGTPRQP
ncbi:MAG: tetratricopeptide repeat protein [Bryobacterales bacterium]|nr:tetratricopeptide repeat protein [Bryobacteraceae bacterium]MDW8352939.1 tetratricopeptide repeat protein [Bryobacterales bacterium]